MPSDRIERPPNPYLFVVGCPRSGTTLLQRMLDHHGDLAVTNDTHFIASVARRHAVREDVPLTAELVAAVRSYRRFYRLGLSEAEVDEAACAAKTYAGFVSALYDRVAARAGKPLAGEKTPDYCRRIGLLHRLFPGSRFLHIVRDGRDVALSVREWANESKGPGKLAMWSREPVGTIALWWQHNVLDGRTQGVAVASGLYHEVAYEALVSRPAAVMSGVAAALGLSDDPNMLRYHVGREVDNPRLSAKSAWRPPTAGLRSWRDDLSERDIALFECLAGATLASFGYVLSGIHPTRGVLEEAERCRAWWETEGPGLKIASVPRGEFFVEPAGERHWDAAVG